MCLASALGSVPGHERNTATRRSAFARLFGSQLSGQGPGGRKELKDSGRFDAFNRNAYQTSPAASAIARLGNARSTFLSIVTSFVLSWVASATNSQS